MLPAEAAITKLTIRTFIAVFSLSFQAPIDPVMSASPAPAKLRIPESVSMEADPLVLLRSGPPMAAKKRQTIKAKMYLFMCLF